MVLESAGTEQSLAGKRLLVDAGDHDRFRSALAAVNFLPGNAKENSSWTTAATFAGFGTAPRKGFSRLSN